MSEHPRREQEPVSVDGALYAIVDGEWEPVGFSSGSKQGRDATPVSPPDGHISLDGAIHAIVNGDWKHVGGTGTATKR